MIWITGLTWVFKPKSAESIPCDTVYITSYRIDTVVITKAINTAPDVKEAWYVKIEGDSVWGIPPDSLWKQ